MKSFAISILCILFLLGSTGLQSNLLGQDLIPTKSGNIEISGVVRRAGKYKIKGPITILKALDLAGGIANTPYLGGGGIPSPYSERTVVLRGNQTFTINLSSKRTQEDESFQIHPGDQIIVPEILF